MRQLFRYMCMTALLLAAWTAGAVAGETVVNATHVTVTATDSAGICTLLVQPAEVQKNSVVQQTSSGQIMVLLKTLTLS